MLLPSRGDLTVGWEWTGWTPDPALGFVPAGHRVEVGGVPFQEVTYSRYDTDREAVAALVAVPEALRAPGAANASASAGAVVAPSGFAAAGEVAPGVHVAVVGGFVVLFLELDRAGHGCHRGIGGNRVKLVRWEKTRYDEQGDRT